ncbi:unnamed protein product, partial [Rotaria sp. Silwood1]
MLQVTPSTEETSMSIISRRQINDGEPSGLTARFTCPNHLNLFRRMIFPIGGCPVISNSVSLAILSANETLSYITGQPAIGN